MNRIIAACLLGLGLCVPPAAAQQAPPTEAPAAEVPSQAAPAPQAPAGEAAPDDSSQDDTIGRDVRCLYVYMAMGTSGKPDMQAAAIIGTFFWYGKLSGQIGDDEIERRVTAVIAAQSADKFTADAQRCGSQMVERGKAMNALGDHLQEKDGTKDAGHGTPAPAPPPGSNEPL